MPPSPQAIDAGRYDQVSRDCYSDMKALPPGRGGGGGNASASPGEAGDAGEAARCRREYRLCDMRHRILANERQDARSEVPPGPAPRRRLARSDTVILH
jgi:hypothetical protein